MATKQQRAEWERKYRRPFPVIRYRAIKRSDPLYGAKARPDLWKFVYAHVRVQHFSYGSWFGPNGLRINKANWEKVDA